MEFESAQPSVVKSIKQRDLLNTWLRLYARDQSLPRFGGRNATVFPETAVLGALTQSAAAVDLVGQEVDSFELGMTATGDHTHSIVPAACS